MKKKALVLALAMFGVCITSFGAAADEIVPKEPSEETAVLAVRSEPATLDLHAVSYNSAVAYAADLLYDGLVYYNSVTGETEPLLAESWENIDDTTWRFHLKEGVLSSEGNPITASDVVYSFQRGASHTELKSYFQYYDTENFEAVDDLTVDIKTFDYFPRIINHLAFYCFSILDQESVEAAGEEAQMREPNAGCGPYVLGEWASGDHLTFVRNDNYYGQKPYFKELKIRFIPDDTSRLMALQSGDVMAVDNILPSQVAGLEGDTNVTVCEQSICQTYEFILNTENEILSDVRVRQAMNYALNKDAALMIVSAGIGQTADGFFHPSLPEYAAPADPSMVTYNPDKARELLAEAGYPDGFEISIKHMENQRYSDMAELAQNAWAEVGIRVNLEPMESAAFFSEFNDHNFDVVAIAGSNSDMIIGLRNFSSESIGKGNNQGSYSSEAMDELIAKARVEKDEETRKEYLAQIQELIREDVPVIPVFFGVALEGTRSSIEGLKLSVMGDVLYRGLQAK